MDPVDPLNIPVFGEGDAPEAIVRPGGYAVILQDGLVAVVAAPGGLFLPGGGQDPEESAEAAAVRECREECGLVVAMITFLGVADEVVFTPSERRHCRKRSSFFLAQVVGSAEAMEPDHVLLWMKPSEALTKLRHGSQRWAVERGCRFWFGENNA
jgi:8-oxo-dGTP diphosphatase